MDIYLAKESAYHYIPQVSLEVALDRLEQKKVQLVSGTLGKFISRAKPEDINVTFVEKRLEAYWQINVRLFTEYERNRTYNIALSGAEIDQVTILGKELPVITDKKGSASLSLEGVEHCVDESRHEFTFDGEGVEKEMSQYSVYAKTEVLDFENFAPDDMLVVPPKALASTIVRSILSKVIKPVEADVILEERIDINKLEINFRPVYAIEYLWVPKEKQVVIEFDALTGEILGHGKKIGDQVKQILTPDLLFDVSSVAAGALVPGGGLAVKLIKVAYDQKKN
jgi:hypothetical protein